MTQRPFGGNWTIDKLERVRKYLEAYAKVMSKQQKFRTAYIDAFAGTGYQSLKNFDGPDELLLPELAEPEAMAFLDGSARQALQVRPEFTKYIFIEKDAQRVLELQKLRGEFPTLSDKIDVVNEDANNFLTQLCRNRNWTRNRAVLFLDPFGMQVGWDTIEAIAETQAIDLWYLFPLGIAVNRLLKTDGNISLPIRQRLDQIFGTPDWYEVFYRSEKRTDLFGEEKQITEKVADFDAISRYFVGRLKTIFPGVAENPLHLLNSRNVPLFLLCFAAANKRGAPIAIEIAEHILKE